MAVIPRHVLIVGGGLAGPCLALSLARHNIRSTIFEIRQTRGDGGGSISLGPNALQVLDRYAGVYDQIRAAGFSYHRFGAFTNEGERLGEIAVGEEGKGEDGYPAVRVMRSTLHKVLLDAGEQFGDMITVKYGARLTEIEEDNQRVTAHFEDGSQAQGDILIGADGMHSRVRQHVLGDKAPTPTFDGLCIIYGFVPATLAISPSPDFTFPAFMFTPSGLFMTIPIDSEGMTLAWVINKPMTERNREQWQELERSGEAARLAKADYDSIQTEPVRSLLDNADETRARLWAAYSIPDLPKWHTSRVCLIGDAAHGLPPNGGQGSAFAFEDAAILTRLLKSDNTTSYNQLFARFEAIRRPRIEKFRKTSSRKGGALKSQSGPWVWYMKKWAFRAFFWWNSGVLQHTEETTYDVDQVDIES
ncbi:putative kynurenine 3-monooxygenase [Naematelia encephala]|uniref:Putative kynurenine 3-monooxygenase n=1 Tax=Naematelia encephala TaxID=71784 RepID=A0A1Y2BKM1_9TREE|nr:putative kynurenine 3-monooxygenase [Naematelia encephala]